MHGRTMKASNHRSNGAGMQYRRLSRLRAPVLIVLFALLVMGGACRRTMPIPYPEPRGETQVAGGGIEVHARFLPGRAEIEQLFKWHMPDSGVVPVQVTLRNNDVVPFTVYCRSGVGGDESFRGFSLLVDGEEVEPLHPIGVLQRMVGTEEHVSYRDSKSEKIVSGTLLPPLGGYFLYREFKIGRYYRPLFKHSFHRSLPSGLLLPLTLEPGETARGYLYFLLPGDESPYSGSGDTVDYRTADGDVAAERPPVLHKDYELRLRAHQSRSFNDSIPVFDAVFPRRSDSPQSCEGVAVNAKSTDRLLDEKFVLTLHGRYEGNDDILFGCGRIDQLIDSFNGEFREIETLSGERARVADAVVCGSLVACALDFTGKSRCYLLEVEGCTVRRRERVLLPRRTRYLSFAGDGLLVVTADDFCRFISLPDMEERRRVRFGHAVKGVARCGDRLAVWDGRRGLCMYGTAGETLLKELGRYHLPKSGDLDFVGCDAVNATATILLRGSGGAGDTLAVYALGGEAGFSERARLVLPAPAAVTCMRGTDCVIQLDGGLLIRLDLGEAVAAQVVENGNAHGLVRETAFLPITLLALNRIGTELIGIGEHGIIVRGSIADLAPDPSLARESRCAVTVLERPPAD
jgi:hypothetical protein